MIRSERGWAVVSMDLSAIDHCIDSISPLHLTSENNAFNQ